MKKTKLLFIVSILIAAVSFTGCASLLDMLLSDSGSPPVVKTSNDPLEGYVFAYIENYKGGYHVAKIVQPASSASKGQAEILDMGEQGNKRWAMVFTTHPADESELAVGEVVLYQSSGFSDPPKETLTSTIWDAYYITDTSDLFKDVITIRGDLVVPVKHLRIPETEIVTN